MTDTIVKIDLTKSPYENDMIHNRWHPDIPMVAWVKPGDDFIIETYDWTGGFIKNDNSAVDVRDIDLSIVHFLSGPIGVKGAAPGDLLVVDLLDVGALPGNQWDQRTHIECRGVRGPIVDPEHSVHPQAHAIITGRSELVGTRHRRLKVTRPTRRESVWGHPLGGRTGAPIELDEPHGTIS